LAGTYAALTGATFTGDVSMNNRLVVLSDVSFNKRLQVAGDVSMNGNLQVTNAIYSGGYQVLTTQSNLAGTYAALTGATFTGDVSMNNRLVVGSDVSFNKRLQIGGDVSMNGNVQIANTINASTMFMAGGIQQLSGSGSSGGGMGGSVGPSYVQYSNTGYTDISMGGRLFIAGGITPTYTTPAFTSNQIGYSVTASLASNQSYSSPGSGVNVNNCSISLTAGVYMVNSYIYGSVASSGQYCAGFVHNISNTLGNSLTKFYTVNSSPTIFELMGSTTIQSNNETWYLIFFSGASVTITFATIKYTRIA
jgi:hypothetical protein